MSRAKKSFKPVLLAWLKKLVESKLDSSLLKYQWIHSQTFHEYYQYSRQHFNTKLLDIPYLAFAKSMTNIVATTVLGEVVYSTRKRVNNKKVLLFLIVDKKHTKNNMKDYNVLDVNSGLSKLLFNNTTSPTVTTPIKKPNKTPTSDSTSCSKNNEFTYKEANQDIGAEYKDPLHLLMKVAASFPIIPSKKFSILSHSLFLVYVETPFL
jgi:hypothetical protein